METLIRKTAAALGFDACGFALVGQSQTHGRFMEWLKRGYAADMDYLARQAAARAHLHHVAPHAKSVIVVAAHYPLQTSSPWFSRHVTAQDYHNVLRGALRQLADCLARNIQSGLVSRICVDSAPLLEREWAMRAGLGWIGKQGSLVNSQYGCCMFLGELLVNIELPPSSPVPNQCGRCERCLKACPTGALQPDGLVDARRCLAYMTIEHKGDIPEPIKPYMTTSVFGCDCCTAVCPWNKSPAPEQRQSAMTGLGSRAGDLPSPEECLCMTQAEFERQFTGTVVYRLGLDRLRRNAAIVIQNRIITATAPRDVKSQ